MVSMVDNGPVYRTGLIWVRRGCDRINAARHCVEGRCEGDPDVQEGGCAGMLRRDQC